MDKSRLKDLQRCTAKIVTRASRPGGSLEKGEFTLGLARRLITEEMGLEPGELDAKEWKGVVKELVNKALDDGESGPSPKKESEKARTKSKTTEKGDKKQAKEKSPVNSRDREREPSSDTTKVDETTASGPGERDGNDSDMSSVIDIAPAPKRRKKSVEGTSTSSSKEKDSGKAKRSKKDVDEGLSPDEVKVAELKRIVVACGLRKQWSKEFAECPSPSSQIRHLQSLLSGLGMKGTPTMGKARSLKEKRELAAELDEVREFEAKRGVNDLETEERVSRSKDRGRGSRRSDIVPEEDTDDDGGDQPDVKVKGNSALDSVLDFLGDQSD